MSIHIASRLITIRQTEVLAQVPDFKYHIINDREPFEVGNTGIKITPFSGEFEFFFLWEWELILV